MRRVTALVARKKVPPWDLAHHQALECFRPPENIVEYNGEIKNLALAAAPRVVSGWKNVYAQKAKGKFDFGESMWGRLGTGGVLKLDVSMPRSAIAKRKLRDGLSTCGVSLNGQFYKCSGEKVPNLGDVPAFFDWILGANYTCLG